MLMGLEMQAAAEAVTLGEGLGIQRSELLEIVRGGGFSAPVMGLKSTRMVARRYVEPDFRLCRMAEDLRVAVQATAHHRARGNGRADLDCAAIADALNGSQP